jgi:hypothetical protein
MASELVFVPRGRSPTLLLVAVLGFVDFIAGVSIRLAQPKIVLERTDQAPGSAWQFLPPKNIAPRPVEAVAGQQADAGGVAPCHQPKAVELDLVQPAGTVGRLLGGRWQAGSMKPGGVRRVRDNMRKPNNRPTSASRIRARGDASEWVFSRPPPAS